ncbi:MAG: hypothetical protein LBU29_03795, partial [Endomicrobium sp.]|nr:hypothetical protein [Endomicrobium sp.]
MSTDRLVKWSKESAEFFEKAEDSSVVLDLVISYACASQTGEGFEELVNTINSEKIKRKVKKVIITDASYLYRHVNLEFSRYADPSLPTDWYLKNKGAIEKLKCPYEIKSWVTGLVGNGFGDRYRQVKQDFFTDSNFKDAVISLAMEFTAKKFYDSDVGRNIDFILEETAYTAENLRGANIVYPTGVSPHLGIAIKKYNFGAGFLSYKASNCARKRMFVEKQMQIKEEENHKLDIEAIDKEVLFFIKEKVSNVNFFVVDKYDNHIYRNYSLNRIIGIKATAKEAGPEVWKNNRRVIEEGKPMMVEENSPEGYTFLSVKYPLVINGKVEGVIGLAVDITDKKKREELQKKLEIQEELYRIAKKVAHDINSPISALKIVAYMSANKLTEKEKRMLEMSITSIESIAETLLGEYKTIKRAEQGEIVEVVDR